MVDDQDIKIAVLVREVAGLREQHRAHKQEITQSLHEISDNFSLSLREIRMDIKNIYEFINRSKGGIATLIFSASTLGGIVVAVVSWAQTISELALNGAVFY